MSSRKPLAGCAAAGPSERFVTTHRDSTRAGTGRHRQRADEAGEGERLATASTCSGEKLRPGAELDHVAILHDVVLALDAGLSCGAGLGNGAR